MGELREQQSNTSPVKSSPPSEGGGGGGGTTTPPEGGGRGEQTPSLQPLPPPSTDDPLYAAISGLLSYRPPVAQGQPIVYPTPQTPIWPVLLVALLVVGGAVSVAYLRREK